MEASWDYFDVCRWRGDITPAQVQGSLIGWQAMGIPFLAGDRGRAQSLAAKFLYCAARREYERLRDLASFVMEAAE